MLLLSVLVGIRFLPYLLGGLTDERISLSGIIKVSVFIILRNLMKPFFLKKIIKPE